jgi:ABC-type amino acid transport substrate-binding protein
MYKRQLASLCLLQAAAVAASAQSSDAVLDRIKKNGAISIGYREASIPFSYLDDARKPIGNSIDICLKVADAVRDKLASPQLSVGAGQPVKPHSVGGKRHGRHLLRIRRQHDRPAIAGGFQCPVLYLPHPAAGEVKLRDPRSRGSWLA